MHLDCRATAEDMSSCKPALWTPPPPLSSRSDMFKAPPCENGVGVLFAGWVQVHFRYMPSTGDKEQHLRGLTRTEVGCDQWKFAWWA